MSDRSDSGRPSVVPEVPVADLDASIHRDKFGFDLDWSEEAIGLAGIRAAQVQGRRSGRQRLPRFLRFCHAADGMLMSEILRFPGGLRRDPAIDEWFAARGDLGTIAVQWFEVMRECGRDVRELLHDGHPTACLGDAAFGYVNAFTAHVNVGFFRGAELEDPNRILEGTGKFMRHVKIRLDGQIIERALTEMIERAYADMKRREQL